MGCEGGVVEICYRRRPPSSLLERAFTLLVKRQPVPAGSVVRIDLASGIDLEFRPA
jgi:hypothetical protein